MNKVFLNGRLGRKPELKKDKNGKSYTHLNIATTKYVEKRPFTYWHFCSVWGRNAEVACEFLDKGDLVLIEGEIQYFKKTVAEYKFEEAIINVTYLSLPDKRAKVPTNAEFGGTDFNKQPEPPFDPNELPF